MHLEDALEEGLATHPSILAWRTPWTEEPGGVQGVAKHQTWLKRLSTHAHNLIHMEIVPPINPSSLKTFGHFVPTMPSSVQSLRRELRRHWKNEGIEEWPSEQTVPLLPLRCSGVCFLQGILRLTHCVCVCVCVRVCVYFCVSVCTQHTCTCKLVQFLPPAIVWLQSSRLRASSLKWQLASLLISTLSSNHPLPESWSSFFLGSESRGSQVLDNWRVK